MTATSGIRDRIADVVQERRSELLGLSARLHGEPETAFHENASMERLRDLLAGAGFTVESGVAGLPTALRATYGTGDLTVGICAEYDALPEIGHACGHNVICAIGAGAALALASVADELGIRVVLLGTPAEEEGGGKVLMLDRGAFDELSVAVMAHPWPNIDIADERLTSLAVSRFRATFHGRASHAASAPHLGLNAADAAVVAQVAIGQLRQQVTGDSRISGYVVEGGRRTNIIPERVVLEYELRTPSATDLDALKERVLNCFRGAAVATGTTLEYHAIQPDYLDLRQDPWLMESYRRNICSVGREPSPDAATTTSSWSTDMGNVSQVLPSIHPLIGIYGAAGAPHTREFADAAASEAAEDTILDGATAVAWTGLDVALDEDARQRYLRLQRSRTR